MKKKVALITGGLSHEAQISYKSAKNVALQIDDKKFETFLIDIRKDGWFYKDNNGQEQLVDKNDFSINKNGEKILFDVALMCIHGTPGEDGKLLAYFDLINLPYTTCSASVSAITMNKRMTVALAALNDIKVANSVLQIKGSSIAIESIKKLKFPIFIKPNSGGSSIETKKIVSFDRQRIQQAIEDIFLVANDDVLIEEFISGREFTVGVYKEKDKIVVLPMSEVILNRQNNEDFFDFEAKYNGKTIEITPAKVEETISSQIKSISEKVYNIFNCEGVVRIDFIYNEEEKLAYMLEINTVPGQTDTSFIPQQLRAAGKDIMAFYTLLIEQALNK